MSLHHRPESERPTGIERLKGAGLGLVLILLVGIGFVIIQQWKQGDRQIAELAQLKAVQTFDHNQTEQQLKANASAPSEVRTIEKDVVDAVNAGTAKQIVLGPGNRALLCASIANASQTPAVEAALAKYCPANDSP